MDDSEEINSLKMKIEELNIHLKWYNDFVNNLITEEENDSMDHIALLRAKRIEIEQYLNQ
jgi:hypothetical protein